MSLKLALSSLVRRDMDCDTQKLKHTFDTNVSHPNHRHHQFRPRQNESRSQKRNSTRSIGKLAEAGVEITAARGQLQTLSYHRDCVCVDRV